MDNCKNGVCSIDNIQNDSYDKATMHKSICNDLNKIYVAKNKDYGDSFGKGFKEYGMTMPIIRLEDKLSRVKSLVKNKERKVQDESLIDSLNDLANYAIMTVIELKNEQ